MSRQIKFRARRIDNGTWVYGRYFRTPLTDENSGSKPEAGWFFLSGQPRHCIEADGVAFVIDQETLGEFTGIKGKNDVEIWEGDVLTAAMKSAYPYFDNGKPNYVAVVEWCFAGFHSVLQCVNPEKSGISNGVNEPLEESEMFEVLGNIHEHPELLK